MPQVPLDVWATTTAQWGVHEDGLHIRETGPYAEGGMALLSTGETGDGIGVVIKRMRPGLDTDPTMRALFESEGRVAECLCHPHIAKLLQRGEDVGGPFLVFERVDGTDLDVVLNAHFTSETPLQLVEVLAVMTPLLRALQAAHTACDDADEGLCIIHRDVSPGNVLLGEGGEVKLTDFGVADSALKSHHTVAGEMKGKFAYMAPEQTRGEALTPAADLFAVGVMLYECLTARRLFDAATDADVVHAVRTEEAPSAQAHNPDVVDELDALVAQLLAKDPSARPQSAAEVADALDDIALTYGLNTGHKRAVKGLVRQHPRPLLGGDAPTARRHTQRVLGEVAPAAPSTSSTTPRWAVATVAALLVVAAGAWWVSTQSSATSPVQMAIPLPDEPAPPATEAPAAEPAATLDAPSTAAPPKAPAKVALSATKSAPAASEAPPKVTPPTSEKARAKAKALATLQRRLRRTKETPPTRRAVRPATSTAPGTSTASATSTKSNAGAGRLFLASEPWAKVRVDGKLLSRHTPLLGWPLAAGEHVVELENPVYKLKRTLRVRIEDGQDLRRFVDLSKSPR